MSTSKEIVLQVHRDMGLQAAQKLQEKAGSMTGTELYAAEDNIPDFAAAVAAKNMLERSAGFVCRSTAGRVVKLIQPYDSSIYTAEPEELPAQWGFAWSTDPKKALPFIELATSPYNTGDCCTYPAEDGVDHVYRSGQDGNVWPPRTVNVKWTDLGTVAQIMGEASA